MSSLAPCLEAFFSQRLGQQREASPHTVAAYRDTFRMLLMFVHDRTGKAPSQLALEDPDADLVGAFLQHLEKNRGNGVPTRNARLAALHSFFKYAAYVHPEHAALIQRVLAIPAKRCQRALVSFLDRAELQALLAAPNRFTWLGRRDHALLLLAVQTGLRIAELTRLRRQDVHFDDARYLRCVGKGRKERSLPLSQQTAAALRVWLSERGGTPEDILFPSRRGGRLSSDAVQHLVARHVAAACLLCPSLNGKHVTPHVLRHTSAMNLLQSGVDIATIALLLGHEEIRTTQIYLHADLALKERALARTTPPATKAGRYRAPDSLLAYLDRL